jgi:hypothetical protein
MTLDELKEQVFELIDREAADPEGVNALLEQVPAGREYFERIKAGLSLADLLPIEEPPAGLDLKILASAGE